MILSSRTEATGRVQLLSAKMEDTASATVLRSAVSKSWHWKCFLDTDADRAEESSLLG